MVFHNAFVRSSPTHLLLSNRGNNATRTEAGARSTAGARVPRGRAPVVRLHRRSVTYGVRNVSMRSGGGTPDADGPEASSGANYDDGDGDDAPAELGDWRAFRARLADAEVAAPEESANRELLRRQNPRLHAEPWWSHATGGAEAGGLLLRTPLHTQLARTPATGPALQDAMRKDMASQLGLKVDEVTDERLGEWTSNGWYAASFAEAWAEGVAEAVAEVNEGTMELEALDPAIRAAIPVIIDHQEAWQEVVLVTEASAEGSSGVTINRPCGLTVAELAGRALGGALSPAVLGVFGQQTVYLGGRSVQPGAELRVLHAHALPAAQELVPGIFMGGLEAATAEVEAGRLQADEFRFFLGERRWAAAELPEELSRGCWFAGAASRPLVLKHCLGLPKPLWLELMDMWGGEYAEVSRRELSKRADLAE